MNPVRNSKLNPVRNDKFPQTDKISNGVNRKNKISNGMKICVVSGIFYPEVGGPATHLYDLCLELAARGYQVAVITYGDPKERYDYPFPIKRISRSSSIPLRLLKFSLQVIKIGRGYDIFYVDHYGLPVALANLFLNKPMVIRVISDFAWEYLTRHNLINDKIIDFQSQRYPLKIRIIKLIQKFYISKANIIIVPSKYVKNMVIDWGVPKEKIRLIYNAISKVDIFISKETAKEKLNLGGKIIVTVGRLIPLKGIDRLVELLPQLKREIKLIVIGDGPEKQNLVNLTKSLYVEDRVIFVGPIARNEILLYLKAADVFILNSETEGLPYSILESMAVGAPVIATNVGGIPELIENEKDGLLIEPHNPTQLRKAILKILENDKLKINIIENAKEKLRLFSFDKMVDEILGLLQYLTLKKKRIVFQNQLSYLGKVFASFLFYSGILWLIQKFINLLLTKQRVIILAYHRVTDKNDFITKGMGGRNVSLKNFESHIKYLKKNYKIISLDNFVESTQGKNNLPKKSVVITFDDGYRDIYTNAFPVLRKHNIPATIFLITDFISTKKLMWLHRLYYPRERLTPDEEADIASKIYLSWDKVKEMSQAGISIGSHTSTHRLLSQLNEEEIRTELLDSKNKIEKSLRKPVLHLAYPFGKNGSFTKKTKEIVHRCGFLSACSRFEGINTYNSDLYVLKRIGIGDCSLPTFALKLVLNELLAIFKKA